MKPYLISLAIGILVGALYAVLRERSPAPPVTALVGLLGMLIGEQGLGLVLAVFWPLAPPEPPVVAPASISQPTNQPGQRHAP